MKLGRGLKVLSVVWVGLALAACGGNGTIAPPMPITVEVPAATQPVTSPAGPTQGAPATPAANPQSITTPEAPAYPAGTPGAGAYPYPPASGTPPAAAGQAVDPAMIDLAKKDLAQRLSVAADQITVVSSAYMDWPDSSLGCPQPGMAYAQVITPGYRIVLGQAQKQYDYHTDLKAALVLCTP
jgi:hypothetical protein